MGKTQQSIIELFKSSDGYKYFFGDNPKICGKTSKDILNIPELQNKLKSWNDELTKAAQAQASAQTTSQAGQKEVDKLENLVEKTVNDAQKKAKNAYITLFVIYLALAFAFIFWTFIITARIKDDNITFGIKEANAYLILAVTLFLYGIIYLFGTLWLVNKRICEKWSVYATIAIIFITAIIFLWCASVLVGIMQNHGKDCKPFSKNNAGNWIADESACVISEGEKDSANAIFIVTLIIVVVVVITLIYWIYSIVKKYRVANTPKDKEMKEMKEMTNM